LDVWARRGRDGNGNDAQREREREREREAGREGVGGFNWRGAGARRDGREERRGPGRGQPERTILKE
jgi:hypothetical protein